MITNKTGLATLFWLLDKYIDPIPTLTCYLGIPTEFYLRWVSGFLMCKCEWKANKTGTVGASFSVDLQWYVGHEDPVTQYRVFLPDSQKHRDIDEMWPALAEYMPVFDRGFKTEHQTLDMTRFVWQVLSLAETVEDQDVLDYLDEVNYLTLPPRSV